MPVVWKILLSVLGIAFGQFSLTYGAHPDASLLAYGASIAGALGAYLVGLVQTTPVKNGGSASARALLLPLAVGIGLALSGCATTGAATPPPAAGPAAPPDLLDALASNPLLDATVADADATLAWVDANGATLGPVKAELARACPRAVKFAVADLRAKLLALKGKLADLEGTLAAPPPGPKLILILTTIKYGQQPDLRAEVQTLKADIALRLDALVTGCGHLLPAAQITALVGDAARAGLTATDTGVVPVVRPLRP